MLTAQQQPLHTHLGTVAKCERSISKRQASREILREVARQAKHNNVLESPLSTKIHHNPQSSIAPRAKPLDRTTPWSSINALMRFNSKDHQFWWNTTGRFFATLLEQAGYSATEQYRELFFYAMHVAPELGPAPDSQGNVQRWRSPGTPDSTPIDFSWEWGLDGNGVVRYSFEPIGPNAGTPLDPLNSHATEDWINRLDRQGLVQGLDLEWYKYFTKTLLFAPEDDSRTSKTTEDFIEETTPRAGTVVALDLEKRGPVMKIYIYPGLKAAEMGIDALELVARSIRGLPPAQYASLRDNVEPLLDYLQGRGAQKWGFETGILSIDLLDPAEARIKIYVRAPHTSVEYLMDALTLGGKLDLSEAGGYSKKALADLVDFWNMLLGDSPDELPPDHPGRARPGFYYTVKAGRPVSPKVYVSPFWFVKSDKEVMQRMRNYLSTREDEPDMLGQMARYEGALESYFGDRVLEQRCGSHYYVGCALQKDQLRLVTYLTPQTFECERERLQSSKGKRPLGEAQDEDDKVRVINGL
ncbi:hypothetical protein PoMZ_10868 [Pyricularia oryzae]|uniref:Tryptophan dimethylallyltransferase n=1 Tax=Pyricularia oryzae TaxID=318829 RepID=A0A4P7NJ01_PYROR|nr:hypothetical protein PoMZ_10868 [Pyricularia oryzae]